MAKEFDLYAAGDALVDIMVSARHKNLSDFGLQAGEHRLISSDFQKKLLENFSQEDLKVSCGGSEANSVIALQQMGCKTAFSYCIGDDQYGKIFKEELGSAGIVNDAKLTTLETTGVSLILISDLAERTMLTSLGAAHLLEADDLKEDIVARSTWMLLTAYKLGSDRGLALLERALKLSKLHNTKIMFSLASSHIVKNHREKILKLLKDFDLVIGNQDEFSEMSAGHQDLTVFLRDLSVSQRTKLIMTAGEQGSFFYSAGESFHAPVVTKVRPVDLTGAGDVFLAGFFSAWIRERTPQEALSAGNLLASKVIQQIGARLV